jgi:hypothetical protein
MNLPDEALEQYRLSLETNPNRFNSIYGCGIAAELLGETNTAKEYFTSLIELNNSQDLNRDRLVYASNVVNGI